MTAKQKQDVKQLFSEKLPVKLKQLARSLELLADNKWPKASIKTFFDLIQKINKSCKSFKHLEGESITAELGTMVQGVIDAQDIPARDAVNKLATRLRDLAEGKTTAGNDAKDSSVTTSENDEKPATVEVHLNNILREEQIYVLSPKQDALAELAEQLQHFGYHIEFYDESKKLLEAADKQAPNAIFLHEPGDAIDESVAKALGGVNDKRETVIPFFVLSAKDTLALRLSGIRAGSHGFFLEPFELGYLIDSLEKLSRPDIEEPYRLLVMEDSKAQAKYFTQIFAKAGMDVKACNHPNDIAEALIDFQPELIVMDMMMPVCSGLELAQVLKQQEKYRDLPIVYLSANNDAMDKLEQMTIAGEDFLMKSIRSDQLLQAVQLRLRRARESAQRLSSNSLTGLLNDSHFHRRLKNEALRSARDKTGLVLVLLNINGLHEINRKHGYHVGDRVIKALANLLKQRLRNSDVTGHYGKNDIGVGLNECSKEDAEKIMAQLNDDFQAIHFHFDEVNFTASFRYGLAELSETDIDKMQTDALAALAGARES